MQASFDGGTLRIRGRAPQHADNSKQYLLTALLCGAATVDIGDGPIRQDLDFSVVLPQKQALMSAAGVFVAYAQKYALSPDRRSLVRKTLGDNRPLYGALLNEFAHYFATEAHSPLAAFVHLYRAAERISFSIPLLYCSTQKDYLGTFNTLKDAFADDAVGELGFFKRFLKSGAFIDGTTLSVLYPVNYLGAGAHAQKQFRAAEAICPKLFKNKDSSRSTMDIEFRDVLEWLVVLRNRFFHLKTGDYQVNIALDSVVDVDAFFAASNPIFISFLSQVTLQSIALKYQ